MRGLRRRADLPWLRRLDRRDMLRLSAGAAGGLAASLVLGRPRRLAADQGRTRDVVVIGGGLAGLMAAYLLSEHDVLLLEREEVAGGRICSGSWGGFTYSLGAAYTGTPEGDMRRFFNELEVEPIPVPPPVDGMAYRGKLYPEDYFASAIGSERALRDYVRMANELMELSAWGIEEAIYGLDFDSLEEVEEYDHITMKQWLDSKGIHELIQRYVDVENRGLFGVSNRDFSFLFDIPELAYNFYEPGMSVDDVAIPEGPVPDFHSYRPDVDTGDVDTWTFPTGMMEVVHAMTRRTRLAGRVETGARVTRVGVNPDKSVTVTYQQGGRSREVRAHAAVLATPAPVTADVVSNGFSEKVMQTLRSIRYTTYVTMALYTSQRMISNAWNVACLDAVFTTLNDGIRTQVPADYRGKAVLGVAMPPRHAGDTSLIHKSDGEILDIALRDIERYLPGIRSKVLGRDIKRFRHAFPVFSPGIGEKLWTLHSDPSTCGPLFLAGDYTVYPTMGGAGISGDLAAERVLAYADTLE